MVATSTVNDTIAPARASPVLEVQGVDPDHVEPPGGQAANELVLG